MCGHADKNVLLLLATLVVGIEEGLEDVLKSFDLVNWALFLHLSIVLLCLFVRIAVQAEHSKRFSIGLSTGLTGSSMLDNRRITASL